MYHMKHIYDIKNIKLVDETVVILGNFDGIHIGHQKLFKVAQKIAKEKNLKTVLFSFYPHPTWILGDNPKSLLLSREEKKDKAQSLGIDIYIEYPFTAKFAQKSATDFVTQILIEQLNCKAVTIGRDYFFGKNQEGNIDFMKKCGNQYGFDVSIIDEVKEDFVTISSSLIRELILEGNVEQAAKLIGEPYAVKGHVIKGNQIGRTIGFPTANIIANPIKVLPPQGAYVTEVSILGERYYGITNIGYNPTVQGDKKTVETFIFDFHKDIYGQEITIKILKFLRPEIKFDSLTELTNQLNKDKALAKEFIYKEK